MAAVTATSDGAHCAWYTSASGSPEVTWAPASAPAEVPSTRSAAVRSTPRAASPAIRPSSQAAPVIPPPPRTSALPAMPAPLPPHAAGGGNLRGVSVEVVHTVTDELVDAFARLIPQLSASSVPPDRAALDRIISSPASTVLITRSDDINIRTLPLVIFRIPTCL